MTNPRPPKPQPTTGTDYDTFLVPRSKTPVKNDLYDLLFALGWRFDPTYVLWYTPEVWTYESAGRLEWAADFSWARIQPPNRPGSMEREDPLIRFERLDGTWIVVGTDG